MNEYDNIIKSAGYIHDIVKGTEPHNRFGAVLAGEALKGMCKSINS